MKKLSRRNGHHTCDKNMKFALHPKFSHKFQISLDNLIPLYIIRREPGKVE